MTQSLTPQPDRLAGLRRFAIAISFLTILNLTHRTISKIILIA